MRPLALALGNADDLETCQEIAVAYHYLHQRVDNRARPMCYMLRSEQRWIGMVMAGLPHATTCRTWWGKRAGLTQWQVVDLCRIYLHPDVQAGGRHCDPGWVPGYYDRHGVWRSTLATWTIHQVLQRIQADRVALWPPVYLEQPYHIRLVISYHDPQYHRGAIYRLAGAAPMYTDAAGQPAPGPAGKYGWCWRLPEPAWTWQDLPEVRSRTLRLF